MMSIFSTDNFLKLYSERLLLFCRDTKITCTHVLTYTPGEAGIKGLAHVHHSDVNEEGASTAISLVLYQADLILPVWRTELVTLIRSLQKMTICCRHNLESQFCINCHF